MDNNTCLRLATRIHFALLRHLGDSVEVQDILHRSAETREVLWVCEASGDDELIALASQFRRASRPVLPAPIAEAPAAPSALPERPTKRAPAALRLPPPLPAPSPASSRDSTWGGDTSGFGVSRPPELRGDKPSIDQPGTGTGPKRKPDRDWLKPRTWLRTR